MSTSDSFSVSSCAQIFLSVVFLYRKRCTDFPSVLQFGGGASTGQGTGQVQGSWYMRLMS